MTLDIRNLDACDPLRDRRALFEIPAGLTYLDGNSLGPLTIAAKARLRSAAEHEWGRGLIASWNDADWIRLPAIAGAKIARVIGAEADEVIVCDSVSVNLFKLAAALKRSTPAAQFAIDAAEFPTDIYILDGLSSLLGERLRAGRELPPGPVILVKSLVDFRTGAVADIANAEAEVRSAGGAIIWDLSHAAGVLDVRIKESGARFAVGCGYKFLNGGPGAPAFVYARRDASGLSQPISGWMGHARPFDFAGGYVPAEGAARFAAGTPPILSLCALDAALDAFDGVDPADVETKARRLGDLFLERTEGLGLRTISPQSGRRGGQVSLVHEQGYAVMQALIARGVVGDFRPPDIMRFGFSPLFLRYADVASAADALKLVLSTEEWRDQRFSMRRLVT
jgi:kynureninase